MAKWFLKTLRKLQPLLIVLFGVGLIFFQLLKSENNENKILLEAVTEIKAILSKEGGISNKLELKLKSKCKEVILNNEKLSNNEIKLCNKVLGEE